MAKRLTLTEYRQENAIELSNEFPKTKHKVFEEYLICKYIYYLIAFGLIKQEWEFEYAGEYPTEVEIEAYLLSKQTEVAEHCPH
jgi:hypothetical protein